MATTATSNAHDPVSGRRRPSRRRGPWLAVALGTAVVTGGVAHAAIPDGAKVIHAC
jgi:hypothetical protein